MRPQRPANSFRFYCEGWAGLVLVAPKYYATRLHVQYIRVLGVGSIDRLRARAARVQGLARQAVARGSGGTRPPPPRPHSRPDRPPPPRAAAPPLPPLRRRRPDIAGRP